MKNIKKFSAFLESEEITKPEINDDSEKGEQDFEQTLSVISEMSGVFYELFRLDLINNDATITDGNKLEDLNDIISGKLDTETDYFESEEDIKVKYDRFIETMRFLTDVETEVNEGLFDKFTGKSPVTEEQIMKYINSHPGRRKAYNSFDDKQKAAYIQFFKENPSLVNKNEIALVKWDAEANKFVKGGFSGNGPGMALV